MAIEKVGNTYFPKINYVVSCVSQKIVSVARAFFDALTRLYEFFFKRAPSEKTLEGQVATLNANTNSTVSSAVNVAERALDGSQSVDAAAIDGLPRSNAPSLAFQVAGEEDQAEEDARIAHEDPQIVSNEGSVVAARDRSLDGSQLAPEEVVEGSPISNSHPLPLDVGGEEGLDEEVAPIVNVDPSQAIVSAENKEKMKKHIQEAAGVIKRAAWKTKALWDWYKNNTSSKLAKNQQLPATHEMVLLIKALINDSDQDLIKQIKQILFIIYDSNLLIGVAKLAKPYKDFSVFKKEFFGPEELEQSFDAIGITKEQMTTLHNHFKEQKFKAMCQVLFPKLSIE